MFYASRVEEFSTDRFGKTRLTRNRWRGTADVTRIVPIQILDQTFFARLHVLHPPPFFKLFLSPPPHSRPSPPPSSSDSAMHDFPGTERESPEKKSTCSSCNKVGHMETLSVSLQHPTYEGSIELIISACFSYADCLWCFILCVCHCVPRRLVGDLGKRKEENKTTCVPYTEPVSTGDPMQIT